MDQFTVTRWQVYANLVLFRGFEKYMQEIIKKEQSIKFGKCSDQIVHISGGIPTGVNQRGRRAIGSYQSICGVIL